MGAANGKLGRWSGGPVKVDRNRLVGVAVAVALALGATGCGHFHITTHSPGGTTPPSTTNKTPTTSKR